MTIGEILYWAMVAACVFVLKNTLWVTITEAWKESRKR